MFHVHSFNERERYPCDSRIRARAGSIRCPSLRFTRQSAYDLGGSPVAEIPLCFLRSTRMPGWQLARDAFHTKFEGFISFTRVSRISRNASTRTHAHTCIIYIFIFASIFIQHLRATAFERNEGLVVSGAVYRISGRFSWVNLQSAHCTCPPEHSLQKYIPALTPKHTWLTALT